MAKLTLGAWLNVWYQTYKLPTLAKTSLRNIEQQIRLHIPSWLKDKRLTAVTVFDVDKALGHINNGRTRRYTRHVLYAAMRKAAQLGYVRSNVLENVDRVSYRKQPGNALTCEEQAAFLEKIRHTIFEQYFCFCLYTGARRNEALDLTWKHVRRDTLILLGTKTQDSYREIPMSDDVREILDAQRKINEEKGIPCGPDDRVFPQVTPSWISKVFAKYCPNHHLHDLRHTFITRCAESGVHPSVAQKLVGHSSARMIMDVYMHVVTDFQRQEYSKFTLFPYDKKDDRS